MIRVIVLPFGSTRFFYLLRAMIAPKFRVKQDLTNTEGQHMSLIANISFDQILVSLMATIALREAMILFLPDDIAGPAGWLIATGEEA